MDVSRRNCIARTQRPARICIHFSVKRGRCSVVTVRCTSLRTNSAGGAKVPCKPSTAFPKALVRRSRMTAFSSLRGTPARRYRSRANCWKGGT